MRLPAHILVPLLSLLLVACAQPGTHIPQASPGEIAAEREAQARAASTDPFPPVVEPVRPTQKMKDRLQNIANRIAPEATRLCHQLYSRNPDKKCNYSLEISGDRGINAFANGEKVIITGPMMVFAGDDTHLAFILSHELAHNIMGHRTDKMANLLIGALIGTAADVLAGSQGMNTGGQFAQVGAQAGGASYSPAYEQEADYVGLYILARAGVYPIEKAPEFWRAMSQFDPQGIYARSTHPTNPERFVLMQKTIAEIQNKQARHAALLPEFKKTQEKRENREYESSRGS